jgi:hypothetical protein
MTDDDSNASRDDIDTQETDERQQDLPLSPGSQIGRLAQTGGTPESRRGADRDDEPDSQRWKEPGPA